MPITPQDYNNDATKGSQLQRLMENEIRDRIKGDIPDVIARALVDLARRLDSLESDDQNLGDVYADSVDAQVLKIGGVSVADSLNLKADLASPTFTGTPRAPTASSGTNNTQIATTAFVKTAVDNGIATADAMRYKGTIAGSASMPGAYTPASDKGDDYKITSDGYVNGRYYHGGDFIVCNTDSTAAATSSNYSTIANMWDALQGQLPYCESKDAYVINIAGEASGLAEGTDVFYETDAMIIPVSATPPITPTDPNAPWDDTFWEAYYRASKKGRVYAVTGSRTTSSSFEKYIPLTYIRNPHPDYPQATEFYFVEVLDSTHNTANAQYQGTIRTYKLTIIGWESLDGTYTWPYYASNASYADTAAKDINNNPLNLGFSSNKVITIGSKNIHAVTAGSADSATYATSAGSATTAASADFADAARTDGLGRQIDVLYAIKQVYNNFGANNAIATTLNIVADSKDWQLIGPYVSETLTHRSGLNFYNVILNFVNMSFWGSEGGTAQELAFGVLTLRLTNSPTSYSNALSNAVIIVPRGNSTFSLQLPFTAPAEGSSLTPNLWGQFDTLNSGGSVNGQQYFYSLST